MVVMQEKNASTPLDLSSAAVLSVIFAPMMIRNGSYLRYWISADGPRTFENEP